MPFCKKDDAVQKNGKIRKGFSESIGKDGKTRYIKKVDPKPKVAKPKVDKPKADKPKADKAKLAKPVKPIAKTVTKPKKDKLASGDELIEIVKSNEL